MSGIQLTDKGLSKPDAKIPVDVQYQRMLEFLIDRKKIQTNWRKSYKEITDKIKEALAALPQEPQFNEFRDTQYFNYFMVEKVMKALEQFDPNEAKKSLLGSYSSPRMQQWVAISKMYQQNAIYLAEGSSNLVSYFNFEIPTIKKKMDELRRDIDETNKKESDLIKSAAGFEHKFASQCTSYKITGKDVRAELTASTNTEAPAMLETITKAVQVKEISKATHYFQEFVNFVHTDNSAQPFPSIDRIFEKGNESFNAEEQTTTKEEIAIEKPKTNEKKESSNQKTDAKKSSKGADLEIDWTVVSSEGDSTTTSVDSKPADAQPTISWDIDPVEETGTKEINWDISLDTSDVSQIEVVESKSFTTMRKQKTLLENADFRASLLTELFQLKHFIIQRISESESGDNMLTVIQFQNKQELQNVSVSDLNNWRKAIENVISKLEDEKFQSLLRMQSNPRFFDRLVGSFHNLVECAAKSKRSVTVVKERRGQAQKSLQELALVLEKWQNKTKELKTKMESVMTNEFPGTLISISGEINSLWN